MTMNDKEKILTCFDLVENVVLKFCLLETIFT